MTLEAAHRARQWRHLPQTGVDSALGSMGRGSSGGHSSLNGLNRPAPPSAARFDVQFAFLSIGGTTRSTGFGSVTAVVTRDLPVSGNRDGHS